MVRPLGSRDIVPLFGALVVGFAVFLLVGYLALFDIAMFDSDLVFISIGVAIGYLSARVAVE